MTAPTHRRFGICFALLGALFLNLTSINYYLMVILLYTFSQVGAKFPDVDHHWQNVKDKTVVNWFINKFIRLTGGKHRSWHTHSIDIALVSTLIGFLLTDLAYDLKFISLVDRELIVAIWLGFCLGWLSHLFADMLNYAGVRLTCFSNKKVRLVPKNLFSMRFKTGEEWETYVELFQKYVNIILGFVVLIYPLILHPELLDSFRTLIATINF